MDESRIFQLAEDFRILITRPEPVLSAAVSRDIESHWQKALTTNPLLFNGMVFSADVTARSLISGHFTEFRRVVAQMRDPALYESLGLHPISVSGVLFCRERSRASCTTLVLGRRSRKSIFQSSIWQLPPAGCLDDKAIILGGEIDWRRQLLSELVEELGMPAAAVEIIPSIGMVEYPAIHAMEIIIPLKCRWSSEDILETHRRSGNDEYEELRLVQAEDVLDTIGQLGDRLSLPARIFLPHLLKSAFTRKLA
jgi:hypothetical protein